jgi:hypothetical protein
MILFKHFPYRPSGQPPPIYKLMAIIAISLGHRLDISDIVTAQKIVIVPLLRDHRFSFSSSQ